MAAHYDMIKKSGVWGYYVRIEMKNSYFFCLLMDMVVSLGFKVLI